MSDLSEWLRHTAGNLINETISDGDVEVAKLCEAADEIASLRAQLFAAQQALLTEGMAANDMREQLARVHNEKLTLWDAINGPGPRCRDCADCNGRCQNDGPACDPQQRALEGVAAMKAQIASARKALEGVYDHMDRNGMANWPVAKRVRKELAALSDEPRGFVPPSACRHPNSCHRHGECMYVGCPANALTSAEGK